MIVVEISAEKKEEMAALCERILYLGGHLMHCIDSAEEVEVIDESAEEGNGTAVSQVLEAAGTEASGTMAASAANWSQDNGMMGGIVSPIRKKRYVR